MSKGRRKSPYGLNIYQRITRTGTEGYYVRIVRRRWFGKGKTLIYTSPVVRTVEDAVKLRNNWLAKEAERYERRIARKPAESAREGAKDVHGVV